MTPVKAFILLWLIFTPFLLFPQGVFDHAIKPADAVPGNYIRLLKGKRVGLIINQTSMIGDSSLLDVLMGRQIPVTKIFVPEHGFRGNEDAGAKVENTTDSATHIPVISLYGKHNKPTAGDLAGVDVVVYDLQDVGVRFYTYIATLQYCMEACAENHIPFIVLDRPDPNGFYVDGPVLKEENKSFVGMQQIPIVYGMTAGEYAGMLVGEQWFAHAATLDLKIIKCGHYSHSKKYELPVAPSPNLKTMAAVYSYPSLCLFEGTVISVGRGTGQPFMQYGCPEFAGKLEYSFTPQSGAGAKDPPYKGKACYGEMTGSGADEVLQKTGGRLSLQWLVKAYGDYPVKDKFFNGFFIKLCGSADMEQQIKDGDTEKEIRKTWQPGLAAFKKIREKYLLYPDF
jgi:uncharacterized protein YbbC (DUF1343 family)